MESQTDGVEWVLGVLFGLGLVAVIAAALREIAGLGRGPGARKDSKSQPPGDDSPPDDGPAT